VYPFYVALSASVAGAAYTAARMRVRELVFLLSTATIVSSFSFPARAQTPRQWSAAEIGKRMQRLSVLGSVLYVAAHPDDENTGLLTYLASGRQVRAAYLAMTRGDGGQNLIGSEQGVALGIIRTQELLGARRVDGAQQLFTRARDFGFTKSVDETMKLWGQDEIVHDTVLAIRRFRPDVIITRFSSSGGGHGHHTASAQIAERAFKAAADPKFETNPRTPPWQARRLLWNRGGGGDGVRLDVGSYDALLGTSYGEMAADSRSMHKSQGFGVARRRGPQIEGFEVVAEAPGGPSKLSGPFDGIDWSWHRVPGGERAGQVAAEAARSFRAEDPAASIPALAALDAALDGVGDSFWKAEKKNEVARLVQACAGLYLEAQAAAPLAVPGGNVRVRITALNRSKAALKLAEVRFVRPAGAGGAQDAIAVGKMLAEHQPQTLERDVAIAAGAAPSAPYWLIEPPLPGRFRLADPALTGTPENQPALALEAQIETGGRHFAVTTPVIHTWTDPVAGERTRPLEVVPAVWVAPQTAVLPFPDGRPAPLTVRLKAAATASGTLHLETPAGYVVKPASAPFKLASAGDETELRFTVQAARGAAPGALRAVADVGGQHLAHRIDFIEHAHIPMQMMVTPSEVRLVPIDLRREGHRIGYIAGAGDEVAASLERVGYQVVLLDDTALATAPLGGFDAIVTGVRAYNTNDRLPFVHDRLMDYVEKGGTLVVQYNTTAQLPGGGRGIGPLTFEIGRERVTEEDAAVQLDGHAVLRYPNKITAADFEGWVQERGLYFAHSWDKKYETPLAMADKGEQPLRGSLLVARHGRGAFIYTGLAFFRQLPAGVPGAYRLFANLIAHGHAPRK
jgi:LmbE family N-acetylglucosaminyl deacetylase